MLANGRLSKLKRPTQSRHVENAQENENTHITVVVDSAPFAKLFGSMLLWATDEASATFLGDIS